MRSDRDGAPQGARWGTEALLLVRQAVEAREETEQRYQRLVESSPDAIFTHIEGRIEYANPAAVALFGLSTAEELCGRDIFEFIHAADHTPVQQRVRDLAEGKSVSRIRERFVRLDGSVVVVEAAASPFLLEGKLGVQVVARDITSRERAERRLAIQHQVSSALAESADLKEACPRILCAVCEGNEWEAGSLWMLDSRANVLRCLDHWCVPSLESSDFAEMTRRFVFAKGFGLPGRVWASGEPAWLPDLTLDPNFPRSPFAERAGLRSGLAVPIVSGRESLGVIEFFGRCMQEPDGELLSLIASVGAQISAFARRRLAEEALRERVSLAALQATIAQSLVRGDTLRSMLQQIAEAMVRPLDAAFVRIWTLNDEENVLELQASAGMYTHINGPHGRVPVGKFKIGLIAQERAPHVTNAVIGDPRVGDQAWAKREGMVAFAGHPLIVAERLVGVVAMFARRPLSDVTLATVAAVANEISLGIERKRAEAALVSAKEAAEAANRSKDEFLSIVSHELRTPLSGVCGMAGILRETSLTAEQREFVEIARKSADQLHTLINEILDFSECAAGKVAIEPSVFDVLTAVEETVDLQTRKADAKGLEIVIWSHADVPRAVVGDVGRIRQVLGNLLDNAIKFTERGRIVVDVRTEESSDGEPRLRMSVQDTGIGILEGKLDTVFERFTQGDASNTRVYGGIGLGLSISRQLVELMGGTMGVVSRVGEGSTFWFSLPLLRAGTSAETSSPPPRPLASAELRFLVASACEACRNALKERIADRGLEVAASASLRETLEGLRKAYDAGRPYDVMVVDVETAGAVAEMGDAVRARPWLSETLIVLLMSQRLKEEVKEMVTSWPAECVQKPVQPSRIVDGLSNLWEARLGEWAKWGYRGPSTASMNVPGAASAPAMPVTGARVLVAEDNPMNQKIAVRMLEQLGCRVDSVGTGREAVQMLDTLHYDLVFMDCVMPEMDGFEATAAIRGCEQEPRRSIPIVAMTANAMPGDRERCLAAGMDDYVSKPLQRDALARVLERWVPQAENPTTQDPPESLGSQGPTVS